MARIEGVPQPPSEEVRQAALDLLHKDRFLDDSIYTPPGAIGHYVERRLRGEDDPGDTTGVSEPREPVPRNPAGAIALENNVSLDN